MPEQTPQERGEERPAVVPVLVGLAAIDAHNTALDARLLAVDQDPTHTPTQPGVVVGQHPSSGTRVPAGQVIKIWVSGGSAPPEDGDGNGGGGGGIQPGPRDPTPLAGTRE